MMQGDRLTRRIESHIQMVFLSRARPLKAVCRSNLMNLILIAAMTEIVHHTGWSMDF
jgi:hypothetical protein